MGNPLLAFWQNVFGPDEEPRVTYWWTQPAGDE